jgi:hypothetical protein
VFVWCSNRAPTIVNRGAIQNVAPVLGSAYGKFQIPLLTWLQCTDNQYIAPNRYFAEGGIMKFTIRHFELHPSIEAFTGSGTMRCLVPKKRLGSGHHLSAVLQS